MMLDWLIIGGGLNGTALSLALTKRDGVPRDRVRVLDAHAEPLAFWKRATANVGMRYLRSPGVHHIHHDPFSPRTFRATPRGQHVYGSIPLYERPSLRFFNTYNDYLFDLFGLETLRLVGRSAGLKRVAGGWRVETDDGGLEARNVVIAISTGENPHRPAWADGLPIPHIFERDFVRADLRDWRELVVIGGGISAAQTALTLAAANPGTVTLLMRHAIREAHFDSDPCWVGPLCLRDFHAQPDADERRRLIRMARNRGSLPPDIAADLRAAVARGDLCLKRGEVRSATRHDGGYRLNLVDGGQPLTASHVVLCTGFSAARPGGAWLDDAIIEQGLPVAACGYPLVDPTLCWAQGLYVAGALAELEVGPVARNLIGGRIAGERIGRAARGS